MNFRVRLPPHSKLPLENKPTRPTELKIILPFLKFIKRFKISLGLVSFSNVKSLINKNEVFTVESRYMIERLFLITN